MIAAGFWRRYAAWSLDAALLALPVLAWWAPRLDPQLARIVAAWRNLAEACAMQLVQALQGAQPMAALLLQARTDPQLLAGADALASAIAAALLPPLALFAALGLLYHLGFEAASRQATPGKRVLGLRVAAADGGQLSPARVALRHLAGALSWLSLNLGHALAALPPQRRTLHDRIAGAAVLQAAPAQASLPHWARAWIALQLLLGVAGSAWLLVALQLDLHRALEAALWAA